MLRAINQDEDARAVGGSHENLGVPAGPLPFEAAQELKEGSGTAQRSAKEGRPTAGETVPCPSRPMPPPAGL